MDCFDKPVKTCQNILWFCKHGQKGGNRTVNFFSVKTTSLSHSERIGTVRLWLDLLGSDSHIEKGCFALKLGFVSAEIFTNFGFVFDDFCYRYAKKL